MKLAYFSPINPQKSGISDYSEALIPHLSKYYDIDLWVNGIKPNNPAFWDHKTINYKHNTDYDKLRQYDSIVYNLGNNPYFHIEMYNIFLKYPGVVILHDYVLYFLITGYYLEFKHDRKQFIEEFYYNYGSNGISSVKNILRKYESPLQFRNPERYPLIKRLVENAVGIIVHSESTRNLVIQQGYPESNVVKINQVNYENRNNIHSQKELNEMRSKYGIFEDDILISSFGYIAPTKRNLQIIEVANDILLHHDYPIKYLMVGEGNYIDGLLNDKIKKTGYIPINEFERLVCCSDIVVNLRNPSMGETSATLLRAMTAGKPCVVTDIAWFSELPDDTVMKISPDIRSEKNELMDNLLLLIRDLSKREKIGFNAQNYALKYHDPSKIAEEMKNFINNCISLHNYDFANMYSKLNSNQRQEIGLNKQRENNISNLYSKLNSERLSEIGLQDCGYQIR